MLTAIITHRKEVCMNLVQLGEERIQKFGETVSLIFEDKEYKSTQINEMGKRLAAGLKSLGIGRGDHVIVSLPNKPEVFACFGAIWRIGAVIVPIMFLLGEDETRYILDLCCSTTVAYQD